MGMASHVFKDLVNELRKAGLGNTRFVTAEEQLAIYLRLVIYGMGNREAQERFQRSADTIHKAFHRILSLTSSFPFYHAYVSLPDDEVPEVIADDPRFHPFHKARAAGDGSLTDAFVQEKDMGRYRSRKGCVSQNMLAGCHLTYRYAI